MVLRPPQIGGLKSRDLYEAIHRGLLQHDRLLMLDTPLGKNALTPLRARGSSEIGRDYHWTVDVASLRDDTALQSLMHQPVTLWIQQRTAPFADSVYRPVHGFVHQVGYLGGDGSVSTYQLEFSSALIFLSKTHNDEGWLEKDVRDVVSEVFNRYAQLQGRFRFELTREPIVRSWCRQSESDLNFVHRLFEDEGWYFYWVHEPTKDGEPPKTTLVIVDQVSSLPGAKPAEYYRGNSDHEADGLTQWAAVQTMQSLRYVSSAFDYKRPTSRFQTESALQSTTYTTADDRQSASRSIPAAPMTVYEPTAYGYANTDRGENRAHRRVQAWDSRARRYYGIGGLRWLDAGSRFTLNNHPRHPDSDPKKREFLIVTAGWFIENNVPIGQQVTEYPRSLRATLAEQQAAHGERFSTPGHAQDGSIGFFVIEVEAQEASIEYRSPLVHAKPNMTIEHAIVVTQQGTESWTNERNQVRVHFAWDHKNPDGTFASSPLLSTMQADTGNGYGSVHVPRAGEWVLVAYWGNDCDKPFILGRVNGGTTPSQWHSNILLSGFQSHGFGGTGAFNAFVHDDATHQSGTRLISYTGKSYASISQGYLIQQSGNTRGRYLGSGLLLHADDYASLRGNRGVSISTHPVSRDSDQLDVDEAREQLTRSKNLFGSISDASEQHQAETFKPGVDALTTYTDATRQSESGAASGGRTAGGGTGNANAFATPLLLLASPTGIGLSTHQSLHFSADQQANWISGQDSYIAAGGSLHTAAIDHLSLFARNLGIKAVAGKGKVEIQAQDDNLEMIAQQLVKLLSIAGRVEIAADQEIVLYSGGATIRIKGGNVSIHAPGSVDFKGASFTFSGPASESYAMPQFKPSYQTQYVLKNQTDGTPLVRHAYELKLPSGRTMVAHTNDLGETTPVFTPSAQSVGLKAFEPDKQDLEPWQYAGGGKPDIWADYLNVVTDEHA
ncbi:TPA: type VI secretion system tip protein VgrG [Burkholderia aenigmatica]|uniref:type VI secretion system Vgr family protein n=1 Tax=Burkholderia sp. AU45251 TaxID=3059204 RepID=UPI00264EA49D|nr:type VI secretion system Vgr family protein [Burkholderia sp. AU45251]HDR9486854.1 type VI secretion system tip protein VgrG [Burkholderia aenigmatica]MDN7518796.1 type VI secretion system Vgr family protein [Burkholderia sp. AU45251]HDR9518768.1 type VI secretion system tip protein VgrG [Burkholderia aenigmatica]HDR9595635.1 type VI secretion system tip protein VgrG [Burkholderia aenigmatica]HDR9602498.1 type VI secretion system tip protein VgrG [Burkholderia aenigmatica]